MVVLADTVALALEVVENANPDLILYMNLITPVELDFPEYPRLVPKEWFEASGSLGWFDWRLFERFAKVARHNDAGKCDMKAPLKVYQSRTSAPGLVLTMREDFFGLIMPMGTKRAESIPDWWKGAAG